MDSSIIAKKYGNSIKNGKITAEILTKLPKLVTVNNWKKVEIKGLVDYTHDVPAVHYKGMMVTYQGGLYYLSEKLAIELGKIDKRFKKVSSTIKVVR